MGYVPLPRIYIARAVTVRSKADVLRHKDDVIVDIPFVRNVAQFDLNVPKIFLLHLRYFYQLANCINVAMSVLQL